MSQAPVMPVYPDALLGDTLDLTGEQFGCYLLLLFATWRNNGKPLSDDDAKLARICRCSIAHWRRFVRPAIIGFFDCGDGSLHQKRLEKEWDFCAKKRAKNKFSGSLGGKARALKKRKSTNSERSSERSSLPLTLKGSQSLVVNTQFPRAHTRPREAIEPDNKTRPTLKILKEKEESEGDPPEGWLAEAEAARANAKLEPVNLRLEWGKFAARADGSVELRRWLEWSLRAWASREARADAMPDAPWAARIRQWQRDGWWLPSFGPRPDEPGCWVPAKYLAEAAE